MNEQSAVRHDFAHFCQVFQVWFAINGWSQARLDAAGGPSKPIQAKLLAGTWTSQRPSDVVEKVDDGFGWPPGTAWRVLTSGYDPIADPPPAHRVSLEKSPATLPGGSVGGNPQDADSLLYRRPDGMSDAEWGRLKNETREYLEWLIDRATRER